VESKLFARCSQKVLTKLLHSIHHGSYYLHFGNSVGFRSNLLCHHFSGTTPDSSEKRLIFSNKTPVAMSNWGFVFDAAFNLGCPVKVERAKIPY
jgi:hypothetical protein